MTDTPIRSQATAVVVSGGSPRAYLPTDWAPDTPVLVVAGLPEGCELRRLCDVPEGWEYQNQTGGWRDPDASLTWGKGLVVCRPVPVPAPPATEPVPWREAVGRTSRNGHAITHVHDDPGLRPLVVTDEPTRWSVDRDGMVEVLVDPAPTEEPAPPNDGLDYLREHYNVPAKAGLRITADGKPGVIVGPQPGAAHYLRVKFDDGSKAPVHPTWNVDYSPAPTEDDEPADTTAIRGLTRRFDGEPPADTPAPQGRWTVDPDGDPLYVDGSGHEAMCIERQLPGRPNARRAEAVDALVDLVRRDGTAPAADQVITYLRDRGAEPSHVPSVLAAVRALRDGETR